MKKFWKAMSGAAIAAMMLISSAGCNFFNSLPVPGAGGHTHTLEKQDAVAATCTNAGSEAYYYCTDPECNKMFSDLSGENQIFEPVITEKKAHTLSKTLAKDSTCLVQGYEEYYTCTSCRKIFSDEEAKNEIPAPTQTALANHTLVKVDAKAATETTAGNTEYYTCSVCKKLFSDAAGKNETTLSAVYVAPTANLEWKAMAGVSDYAAPTYSNGTTTFNALNNSSYLENVFVDENGNSLVGAYNPANANTEYTYSMNIKASGTFHLALFANETTIPVFNLASLAGNPKYGFYIRFDAKDTETSIKVQAAFGQKSAEEGIKAKGASTFKFDGTTENNLRLVVERYSEDKLILHIWVNGEEVIFNKTSTGGSDKVGFNLRTEWNRNDPINGIGESHTAKDPGYPTICCGRGLDDGVGLGAGLAVAVTGDIASNAISGIGQAPVVISHLTATKTGEQVVHTHSTTPVEGVDATCTTEGYQAYYTCECGKLFSDAEATNQIAAPIVIPVTHDLTHVPQVDPTETEAGCKEYWSCGICTKLFADANGTVETTLDALYLAPESHKHSMEYTAAAAATALKDGNIEYWYCTGCETYYADSEGAQALSSEQLKTTAWNNMADSTEDTKVVTNGISATLTGLNGSSYVDNVFVDANGNEIVGALNAATKNTEYKLSMKVVANSSFSIVLFANETTPAQYLSDGVTDKLGLYFWFDAEESTSSNIKLYMALGQPNAVAGTKAKGDSNFNFDGTTANEITVTVERYSDSKAIVVLYVNGTVVTFTRNSGDGQDKSGFTLRTAWDRTLIFNDEGIGDSVANKKSGDYISAGRGLSETEGYGNGLGISVLGVRTTNDAGDKVATGLTALEGGVAASVVISEFSFTQSQAQVVHTHAPTLVEKLDATCTVAGYEAYYECECGKLYSDEAATNEIEAPVVIDAGHKLTHVAANDATETEAGNKEYWSCSVCQKVYLDEAATQETTMADVTLPALGHTHVLTYYAPVAATTEKDGTIEYWYCEGCKNYYEDSEATTVLTVDQLVVKAWNTVSGAWKNLKDVTEGAAVVTDGKTATFTGANSSSYIDNVFEAGLAGAYDSSVANTEYTLTAKFKTNSSFAFVLFADEATTSQYTDANIPDGIVADRLGYYIIFESDDTDSNVKLKSAVGNGINEKNKKAESSIKAKAFVSSLNFDGVTENTLKVTIERYSVDKLILHIYVNSEEAISFNMTGSRGADACGFNMRTAWDRTNIVNDGGIGKSYNNTANAYPTLSISRGLSETEGLGCGLGVSVYGVKNAEGNYSGLASDGSAAFVTVSELSVAVTGAQVTAA